MITIHEIKGKKLVLKVAGSDFFQTLSYIKKELIGRKYNEATKMWEVPILKTNLQRLKNAEGFEDDGALWALAEEAEHETFLIANNINPAKPEDKEDPPKKKRGRKPVPKMELDFYQDKEINDLIREHRQKGDRSITLENRINGVIMEIKQLEEAFKKMMDFKVKDWTEEFREVNEEASNRLLDQVGVVRVDFQKTKDKIQTNLNKLKLGALKDAVIGVVEGTFEKRLEKITDHLDTQLKEDQKAFTHEINKINDRVNADFIQLMGVSIEKVVQKWDRKKWILTVNTWETIKDKVENICKDRDEKFEINC